MAFDSSSNINLVGMEKKIMTLQEKVDQYYLTGNEKDWGEVYLALQPKLLFYLRNYIGDNDTREEIVSRAFVKIWERRSTYNPEFKFTTWAFRITLNETRIYWRETKDTDVMEIFDGAIMDDSDDYTEKYSDALYLKVLDIISKLKEPYKSIITMCDVEQLSYEEISKRTGEKLNTVKTRIKRAREKVRREL